MPDNRNLAEAISVRGAAPQTNSAWQPLAARRLLLIGEFMLRYSLVFFLVFFGALKWTAEEAKGIQPWMEHSPLLFWLVRAFGIQAASECIGAIEITIGGLIAMRSWSPRLSAIGSAAAMPMFLTTLSFLVTTPNVGEASGFLLKDLTLLGAAIWTAGEALQAETGAGNL
jgi:reactive chlorine resistance protein C